MVRRTAAALHGALLWTGLARRYDLEHGVYVLLMPEDDPELNAAAMAHIDDLVADRRAHGIVVVSDTASPAPEQVPGVVAVERWTARKIDALISFYELYAISDRLLILSLTRPFGNGLHRLLGRQGVTTEDLACLGCLRLRGYGMVRA